MWDFQRIHASAVQVCLPCPLPARATRVASSFPWVSGGEESDPTIHRRGSVTTRFIPCAGAQLDTGLYHCIVWEWVHLALTGHTGSAPLGRR